MNPRHSNYKYRSSGGPRFHQNTSVSFVGGDQPSAATHGRDDSKNIISTGDKTAITTLLPGGNLTSQSHSITQPKHFRGAGALRKRSYSFSEGMLQYYDRLYQQGCLKSPYLGNYHSDSIPIMFQVTARQFHLFLRQNAGKTIITNKRKIVPRHPILWNVA